MPFGSSHRQCFLSFLFLFALGEKEWNISRNHIMQISFLQASSVCPGEEMKQKRKGTMWQSQRRPQVALPLWTLQLCWDVCFCRLCAVFSSVALHTEKEPSLMLPSVSVFSSYSCLSSACLSRTFFPWDGCKEADAFWIVEY